MDGGEIPCLIIFLSGGHFKSILLPVLLSVRPWLTLSVHLAHKICVTKDHSIYNTVNIQQHSLCKRANLLKYRNSLFGSSWVLHIWSVYAQTLNPSSRWLQALLSLGELPHRTHSLSSFSRTEFQVSHKAGGDAQVSTEQVRWSSLHRRPETTPTTQGHFH